MTLKPGDDLTYEQVMSLADLHETAGPNSIEIMFAEIGAVCHDYLEANDYAKSIGAIE